MKANGPNFTVMSSTGTSPDGGNNFLSLPRFEAEIEKLAWRKAVRYWAVKVNACADGGEGRAKGALCALEMTLFRSLPGAKQQALMKLIESGELSLEGSNDYQKQRSAIEKIMSIVTKDSTTKNIQRLALLSRDAMK